MSENGKKWLSQFFKENKWLFELLGIFIAVETFLYSFLEGNDLGQEGVVALKIVFWFFILLITFLLFDAPIFEIYSSKEKQNKNSFLNEVDFIKLLIRSLVVVIQLVVLYAFIDLLMAKWNNPYFFYVYMSLGVLFYFCFGYVIYKLIVKTTKKEINKRIYYISLLLLLLILSITFLIYINNNS